LAGGARDEDVTVWGKVAVTGLDVSVQVQVIIIVHFMHALEHFGFVSIDFGAEGCFYWQTTLFQRQKLGSIPRAV
jgi:hypothetical protein